MQFKNYVKVSEENVYLKRCLEKFTGSEVFWEGVEDEEEEKYEHEMQTSIQDREKKEKEKEKDDKCLMF